MAHARQGQRGAAITYRSHRRHAALVTGGRVGMAINLDRKSHVTIDGLRIATDAGRWVQARLADHIRIVNCRMDKASRSFTPISICDSRHVWLVDNTFAKHLLNIKHIRLFRFYTHQNATKGHEFWFDDFAVLPER